MITTALALFGVSIAINALLFWRLNYTSRKLSAAQHKNQQQKEVITRAKKAKQNIHDAYRLDADELDKRLQQDFRD